MGFSGFQAAGRWVALALMLLGFYGAAAASAADAPAVPFKLTGDVTGPDGKPVEGAMVMVPQDGPGAKRGIWASTRSGPGGLFAFEKEITPTHDSGGYAQPYQVFAFVPGVGFSPPAAVTAKPVHLALAAGVDVQITLVEQDGKPAEGVTVLPALVGFPNDMSLFGISLFLPDACSREFVAKTGADGKCVLHGMPQGGRVRPDTDDVRYAHFGLINGIPLREEGPMIEGGQIQVVKASSISGRLVVPATVKPEEGRGVDAQMFSSNRSHGAGSAVTNGAGEFALNQLVAGTYVVALRERTDGPTEWVAEAKEVTVKEGENATVDLVMTQGGILKGQVRDAVTKKPLAGAGVGLHGPARPSKAGAIYSRMTDAQGRYEFRVPGGLQQPYVNSTSGLEGYLRPGGTNNVLVQEGETVEFDFDIQPDLAPFLEGTVVDAEGKPLADASVRYEDPKADQFRGGRPVNGFVRTNAQGQFRFHGNVGMVVRARWQDLATAAPVPVLDERPMEVKLQAHANFSVVVKLVDENGGPAAGATATLMTRDVRALSDGPPKKADAQGKVKFGPLDMDENYSVTGQGAEYGIARENLEKPPLGDEASEVAVSVILPRAKFEVGGVVVGGDNKPRANVLMSIRGQKSGEKETHTDAQGRFGFHVMDEAPIQVYVGGNRELTGVPYSARAGDTELKLEMPK